MFTFYFFFVRQILFIGWNLFFINSFPLIFFYSFWYFPSHNSQSHNSWLFNYMWINFQVFIDRVSGYWSFYYLFFILISKLIFFQLCFFQLLFPELVLLLLPLNSPSTPPIQNLINNILTIKNMSKGLYSSITVLLEIVTLDESLNDVKVPLAFLLSFFF